MAAVIIGVIAAFSAFIFVANAANTTTNAVTTQSANTGTCSMAGCSAGCSSCGGSCDGKCAATGGCGCGCGK